MRASVAGSFSPSSPAMVARTTLWGFAEPSDLVRMLVMPADSTTARTAPPAMMPVPSGAGFSSTLPAPNTPTIGCGMVEPFSGTRIRFFFAASIPFLMADGTSFALPTPKPTTPCPSPTTTSALKLRFLPPLTTLVTRLIETTVSLRSSCDGSMRSRVFILELQPGLAGRFGDGLDAAVVQEPVAIEDHARDALGLEPLGDRTTDRLGAGLVAAALGRRERRFQRRLEGRGRRDRAAGAVVDDLRVHVRQAPEDGQPRPLRRTRHPLANPVLDPVAPIFLRLDLHGVSREAGG